MTEALMDASALIDLERAVGRVGQDWATNTTRNFIRYKTRHGAPFLSAVTVVEVARGLYANRDSERAVAFGAKVKEEFDVISVDLIIGLRAAKIMAELRGKTIGIADSIIAATAIERSLVVVTSNMSHFNRVAELGYRLELLNWREPTDHR